mmetsp:Transcript_9659/g.36268  ORF Transcript_9659/g.36268 Transcript_9659/m.36268 type:complete len:206 (+) Transcript_9659:3815-4432(+)|eukprot:scaffold434_cov186-Pinguiococcus_pyrenoidosus.AAC.6
MTSPSEAPPANRPSTTVHVASMGSSEAVTLADNAAPVPWLTLSPKKGLISTNGAGASRTSIWHVWFSTLLCVVVWKDSTKEREQPRNSATASWETSSAPGKMSRSVTSQERPVGATRTPESKISVDVTASSAFWLPRGASVGSKLPLASMVCRTASPPKSVGEIVVLQPVTIVTRSAGTTRISIVAVARIVGPKSSGFLAVHDTW